MATAAMRIGSAEARAGEMAFGAIHGLTHFDGTPERLPVIVARGREEGPCLWVTANIHGDEPVGLLAVQQAVTQGLATRLGDLRGTVVAIPSLNPAGLRVSRRQPYYDPATDPNRAFPDAGRDAVDAADSADEDPPSPYETVGAQIFTLLRESGATAMVDLHAMDIQATPFTIRDHILYRGEERRPGAERLAAELDGLARAFGIPVINEYAARRYLRSKLHRSTAGAALHVAGIPAITAELGMGGDVEPGALRAGVAGIHNALVWAKMLSDDPITIDWIPQPDLGYPVRREPHPRAPQAGIVHKLVAPGELVRAGQVVARLHDIWGRPFGPDEGALRAEKDGWVINLRSGAGVYAGQAVMDLAVRDDDPTISPWPEGAAE